MNELSCKTPIVLGAAAACRGPIIAPTVPRVASFRNPRRVRDAFLRISFLTLAIVLWYPVFLAYFYLHLRIGFLIYSLIILTTVVLYLLACDPLPPCTSKAKAWLRGLLPSRAAVSAEYETK